MSLILEDVLLFVG